MNSEKTNVYQPDTSTQAKPTSVLKPLRRWVPILILPAMLAIRFVPRVVEEGPPQLWMFAAFGPVLFSLLLLIWWLVFSRASAKERLMGLGGLMVVLVLFQILCDSSMRKEPFVVLTIPLVIGAFGLGTVLFGKWLSTGRTSAAVILAGLASIFLLVVRTDGMWGDFAFSLSPRWKPSKEAVFLSQKESIPRGNSEAASDDSSSPAEFATTEFDSPPWQSFRGPTGDNRQTGIIFDSDWQTNPPRLVWRIDVGPAWSSFVATAGHLFTQEQRGDEECVVCYNSENGKEVWAYANKSRFFESLGGLGPRATPTLSGTSLYALGAAGKLVKLHATTGKEIWQVDLLVQADLKSPPMWGFASSPLVYEDIVVVYAGGVGDKGVLAFHSSDGTLAWSAAAGQQSYASVQQVELLGQKMLGLLSEVGSHFWNPKNGELLLQYDWKHEGYRALQPQVVDGDKLLIGTGMGTGTRLVQLRKEGDKLTTEVLWSATDMKPDFNDFLVHQDAIYGFDNRIYCCVDLKTGKKKWKGGRYEKGQALLLADSDLIVVISETGELVLLRTNSNKLDEIAKLEALHDKTWNHPIVVGDRLYLRSANEAVCFQLPVKPINGN